ncbi:MAG: hypothetical protein AAF242_20440, partial [Bacteroidota bacterium]
SLQNTGELLPISDSEFINLDTYNTLYILSEDNNGKVKLELKTFNNDTNQWSDYKVETSKSMFMY